MKKKQTEKQNGSKVPNGTSGKGKAKPNPIKPEAVSPTAYVDFQTGSQENLVEMEGRKFTPTEVETIKQYTLDVQGMLATDKIGVGRKVNELKNKLHLATVDVMVSVSEKLGVGETLDKTTLDRFAKVARYIPKSEERPGLKYPDYKMAVAYGDAVAKRAEPHKSRNDLESKAAEKAIDALAQLATKDGRDTIKRRTIEAKEGLKVDAIRKTVGTAVTNPVRQPSGWWLVRQDRSLKHLLETIAVIAPGRGVDVVYASPDGLNGVKLTAMLATKAKRIVIDVDKSLEDMIAEVPATCTAVIHTWGKNGRASLYVRDEPDAAPFLPTETPPSANGPTEQSHEGDGQTGSCDPLPIVVPQAGGDAHHDADGPGAVVQTAEPSPGGAASGVETDDRDPNKVEAK